MWTSRAALALSLSMSLPGSARTATLATSSLTFTGTAKITSPSISTLTSTTTTITTTTALTPLATAEPVVPTLSIAPREPGRPVRALYGDLDAFRAWVDAEDRALAAAASVRRRAADGVGSPREASAAEALRLEADSAWRKALASYGAVALGADETLVFVRLHDRVALRLLMELMRPRLSATPLSIAAESLDPVSARWLAKVFHAAVEGDDLALNLHTRMLRERLGFARGDERARIFSRALAALDRLDGELADAGLSAGDAVIDAMLPGLAAIAHGDPCAPDASVPIPGGSSPASVAPTREDVERLDRLGVALDELRGQAQIDCGIASTDGGSAGAGLPGGYGSLSDAMACLGEAFGKTEEPADYGMCIAAGLGATAPDEIGPDQIGRARDCSNPLADGREDYEPFDFGRWYHEEFVEEELLRGESPLPQPPEDEDQKRREEIDDHYRDATVIEVDDGLIEDVVGAIVDAVKAVVEWIVEQFSDEKEDAPAQDATPPETPEDDATTSSGPDGIGGEGCVDPLVELAGDCVERVLSQLPGYRSADDLIREPGSVGPIVIYPWEGSDQEIAGALQGCGGMPDPGSLGCAQLTDPPTACDEPLVSDAARYFAEQALRDRFCSLALCAADLPCECTEEMPVSTPPAPGDPGDPVGPAGTTDPLYLDPALELGTADPVPLLDPDAGTEPVFLGIEGTSLRR